MFSSVVEAIDAAYATARADNRNVTAGHARIFISCHQSMYSAASCLARGLPLDAAASSRRALEAARTALAIKLDLKNSEKWLAYEERLLRWKTRRTNEKPPKLKIDYAAVNGDFAAEKLACFIGMLSDAAVHFTPEFLSHLDFQDRKHGTELFSDYLEDDERTIAHHLKQLAAVHLLILKTLDRCCDGGLSVSPKFPMALQNIAHTVGGLYREYPVTLRPELEAEFSISLDSRQE